MPMDWKNIFILPPRPAAMTAFFTTVMRTAVMASSRPIMTAVTHHHRWPCHDSRMRAAETRALSARESAIFPKSVMRPRLRARYPSALSVAAASAKTNHASADRTGVSLQYTATNTGTRMSRRTVKTLATLRRGAFAPSFSPMLIPPG